MGVVYLVTMFLSASSGLNTLSKGIIISLLATPFESSLMYGMLLQE